MTKWTKSLLIITTAFILLSATPSPRRVEVPTTEIVHQSSAAPRVRRIDATGRQLVKFETAYRQALRERWFAEVDRRKVLAVAEATRPVKAPRTQRVESSQPAPVLVSSGGRIPYDYAKWLRVHNCEQPETWHAGGHFGNGLPAGGNGLGFSLYAWRMAVNFAQHRGVTLPSSGWDASPDQQMQAAQAMLDATGGGPACL